MLFLDWDEFEKKFGFWLPQKQRGGNQSDGKQDGESQSTGNQRRGQQSAGKQSDGKQSVGKQSVGKQSGGKKNKSVCACPVSPGCGLAIGTTSQQDKGPIRNGVIR